MSRCTPPLDVFGRASLPSDFDRRQRVKLTIEFVERLLAGEMPSDEARLFVAGGFSKCLAEGGDLFRDYLRIRAPRGSHLTPAALARRLAEDEDED